MARPGRDADRPLIRRGPDGLERTAPSWESLTERLIREAQEDGAFAELPHRGSPLPIDDETYAGDMAMAFRVLHNAGAAPPWIEADKEARRLEAAMDRLLDGAETLRGLARQRARERLLALARDHAVAVDRLAVLAPTPRQHRRRVDATALLARFDSHRGRGGRG
jgi:hypothetical protein